MVPLVTVALLGVGIPVVGLAFARWIFRRRPAPPLRPVTAIVLPALAIVGALTLGAWAATPASTAWLGETRPLERGDAFRWSLFLHAAIAWPGLLGYAVLAPVLVFRWRRRERSAGAGHPTGTA